MGRVNSTSRCQRNVCRSSLLLLVLAVTASTALAASCDSGIIQMKPFPVGDYDACFTAPASTNSIKAICGVAMRVRVKDGIVKIAPLEKGTFNYSDVGPGDYNVPFDCKNFNASGLFYSGSTTSASVMLYDDFGGPLSNLTKTGANQISLIPGHTYSYKGPPVTCVYNYTVVEGCVFGVKAAYKAASCPAGYYKKTGRFNKSYCAPCAPGTYASKAGAACKPCPVGTYNSYYGATKCTKCQSGTYANTTGTTYCNYCESYENSYTDGVTCYNCPKGSYVAPDNKPQCLKCQAGKKCCTVGWNKDCPKCTDGSGSGSYSSIFALESTTPSSCLKTGHALCAPKINITVDDTCTVSLDNLDNSNSPNDNTYCSWSTTVPVQGAKFSISDIAKFDYYYDNSTLLSGNFTSAASPYLNVYIPDTKCTLRYRALTSPAAAILGAAPKPSKATKCPAGRYLETKTDAKPGPCLLCPPGKYSPKPSSGRTCIRCKAGTYTDRYGSVKCKKCPAGRYSKPGAASCTLCDSGSLASRDGKSCITCPKDSDTYFRGAGPKCLGNAFGSICCAAGNCKGQVPCKGTRSSFDVGDSESYTAIFQIVSKNLAQPACKNATYLSCLPVNGKVQLSSYSSGVSLYMDVYRTKFACAANYSNSYSGGYSGTSSAYITSYEEAIGDSVAYGLVSDAAKGTVTVYLGKYMSNWDYVSDPPAKADATCSITLKLLSGYAFDLTPPKGATCDPRDAVDTYQGRKFCRTCNAGQFKNSTGLCEDCPRGYYNDEAGSGACKPCPAGYSCSEGTSSPYACGNGYYSNKPKQGDCRECPVNTFGTPAYDIPTTKCTACPKGTIAPTTATACGVAWDKVFPA